MASLLPIPDDPLLAGYVETWPDAWLIYPWPRTAWLRHFEERLRHFYPQASSRDLSLTARHAAPFYLAAGHDVP